MTRDEAKEILLLYRPGTADAEDPQVARALEAARQDEQLGRWFEQHIEFQSAMRRQLRQIQVPERLKAGLLASNRRLGPAAWWPRLGVAWLAAAAVIVLGLALAAFWPKTAKTNRFASFQERMVGQVMREYVMEWTTSDTARLRQSIASRGGPSDYDVPRGVQALKLTGGGVLSWQSNPVSMVCFDRGGGRMLFLFVMKRTGVKDPPPSQIPRLALVHEWMTASWTRGDNTYVLTGPQEADPGAFAREYLY